MTSHRDLRDSIGIGRCVCDMQYVWGGGIKGCMWPSHVTSCGSKRSRACM